LTGLDHQGLLILNNAEYIDTSDFSKHTHYCFTAATGLSILKNFLSPNSSGSKVPSRRKASNLAKRVIACLDVRSNDSGDLVVTKGDQYDVRDHSSSKEVRNLGKPVDLASQYYIDGADEVSFLNITGFRDFPLGDLPMLEVLRCASEKVFVPLTVGGGIRDFTDANGRYYSSLEVASEYFRSGADKISIGSDAVFAAEAYLQTGVCILFFHTIFIYFPIIQFFLCIR
jgi:glutamine amidotransferase/cyclase